MKLNVRHIELHKYNRALAISDIHGNLQTFDTLLGAIQPTDQDLIITLGDYVDRGHFSAQVIDRLIALHQTHNIISLRGNHDQWMIDAKDDDAQLEFWTTLGGNATLASYEEESIAAVPDAHWQFLTETCTDIVESEQHIFVHGHLEHDVPLTFQRPEVIQMLRFQNAQPHESGKTVVCGHSSTKSGMPEDHGHTIAIETKHWLNCVDVLSGRIWRTDSTGLCDETMLL